MHRAGNDELYPESDRMKEAAINIIESERAKVERETTDEISSKSKT